ncbi:hypothetical protein BC940DRAFT_145780 [Gongronella butleri]|nr:hypothetical protein BC940DRAFT_145780 [Gongronella butleri]
MSFEGTDRGSVSTSRLPRPSASTSKHLLPAVPVSPASSASSSLHLPTRRSYIPLPKRQPSTSTAGSAASSVHSRSSSLLLFPPGKTHSTPSLGGRQNLGARVVVQCLGTDCTLEHNNGTGLVQLKYRDKRYWFDAALQQDTPLTEVHALLAPVLRQALDGYNGTILSYGPAQCGKSRWLGKTRSRVC